MLGDLLQEPEVTDHVHVGEVVDGEIPQPVPHSVAVGLGLVSLDAGQAAAPHRTPRAFVLGGIVTAPTLGRVSGTHRVIWKK